MLPGKVDASFWRREIRHHGAELSWFGDHESAFGKRMVQPRPCRCAFKVFAHAGIFSREIFVGIGHHNAALTRLIESGTPDLHREVHGGESVAAVGFPEAA